MFLTICLGSGFALRGLWPAEIIGYSIIKIYNLNIIFNYYKKSLYGIRLFKITFRNHIHIHIHIHNHNHTHYHSLNNDQ